MRIAWMILPCVAVMASLNSNRLFADQQPYEGIGQAMGVEFRIVLYADSPEKAATVFKAAFHRIDELDSLLSDYKPESEISQLTRSAGSDRFVPVSKDVWKVLRRAREISELSDGAFDTTLGPLTQLWRTAIRSQSMPDDEQLAEARERSGFRLLEFDESQQRVKLIRAGMRIDLGGIAKGYAADEALKIIRDAGCPIALVDGSGDIALGDKPPGKPGWRVQVALIDEVELVDEKNRVEPKILILSNCGVATSGDQYQFIESAGKRYSHIVDPRTGYGVIGKANLTVVAANATDADAFASAVAVLQEDAIVLIENQPHTEALIQIKREQQVIVHESAGFSAMLLKEAQQR
jgi:thiamine biosynthesis lipoprotein